MFFFVGDMAPKYKTLLLNAFLAGTKDDDHLIRASSLSNLGEVCRVLGYKLGSIVNEVGEKIVTIWQIYMKERLCFLLGTLLTNLKFSSFSISYHCASKL